jgi:hypothetical protein
MWIFKLIVIFFLLFDINFVFLPGVTTARTVFVLLLGFVAINSFKSGIRISKVWLDKNRVFLSVILVIFFVSIFQFIYSKDFTQIARLTYFIIYGFFTPYLLRGVLKSRAEFALLISIAVFIQALLTLTAYFNPAIKDLFKTLILYNANFADENTIRALGFVSVGGAAFSVIQFTGIATMLYLLRYYEMSLVKQSMVWIGICIILFSLVFIGRTGLFLALFAILVYFVSVKISVTRLSITAIIGFLVYQIDFVKLLESATANLDGFDINFFIAWLESGFRLNNDLVQGLSEMPIPPLTVETIIGTGMVMHPSGFGNASGHDTGYIQTYYSLGLVFAIVFYLNYYSFLLSHIKLRKDLFGFLLFILLVFIESKEFFIFSYTYPLFLFSFLITKNGSEEERIYLS